eukprot:6265448-Alexandrium_andersonii.AAC.1
MRSMWDAVWRVQMLIRSATSFSRVIPFTIVAGHPCACIPGVQLLRNGEISMLQSLIRVLFHVLTHFGTSWRSPCFMLPLTRWPRLAMGFGKERRPERR